MIKVRVSPIDEFSDEDFVFRFRQITNHYEGVLQLPPHEGREITNMDLLMLGVAKCIQTVPFCEAMIKVGNEVVETAQAQEVHVADG